MGKIKMFISLHIDEILIILCLFLSVIFSSFLGGILDKYSVSTLDRIIITGLSVVSLTFIDTAVQTYKHKLKR